jgi:lipid A disaccharide synthetase
MTLEFPNQSRSFDDVKQTVRFQGHDGMFEVRFVLDAAALLKKSVGRATEAECLSAFDTSRSKIQTAAAKLYQRTRRSGYAMTAADLN